MSPEIFTAVCEAVSAGAKAEALKSRFADLRFTFCSEDDMPARVKPVFETATESLYLVGAPSGHCLGLTRTADDACGIVVAEKSPD